MNIREFSPTSTIYFGVPKELEEVNEADIQPIVNRVDDVYHCTFCSHENKTNSSAWVHARTKHDVRPLTPQEKKRFSQIANPTSEVERHINPESDTFVESIPPLIATKAKRKVSKRNPKKSPLITSQKSHFSESRRRAMLLRKMEIFLGFVQKERPYDTVTAEKVQELICRLDKRSIPIAMLLND